ncbi:MAG: nucleotidyl transferase AbiEii/AbiGii toxin family protein [Cyclobacteriaceae bacterium]|jgi:predicted nucleotidyltransferase component of viral defense system|nr:nucleotidyl transferase AbiEii/AbiGii toxin family protein [Flammeovirgaceae bacterium]
MLHHSTIESKTFGLLVDIFKIPFISERFALAGGTSLALQIGHRRSIDLDLFSPNSFIPTEIENLLFDYRSFTYEAMGKSERMLFCNINKVKCDFVHEPFPLIKPFIEIENVKLYSVPDIAAMKLHTICGRGKKKDFFDLYALLQLYSWDQLVIWFKQKYGESQLFFLWKSITYFSDAEEDVDIKGIAPYSTNWENVKNEIISKCR